MIPSVGCPLGCNFCSTSAMFGGKGRFVSFYEDGDQLFEVMRGIEQGLGVRAFFVMDENFLLHRKRALRLLELMQEHGKAWALYVFSSANALRPLHGRAARAAGHLLGVARPRGRGQRVQEARRHRHAGRS